MIVSEPHDARGLDYILAKCIAGAAIKCIENAGLGDRKRRR
jgi:hypothetical protein